MQGGLTRLVVVEQALSSAEQMLLWVLNDYERHHLTWMLQRVECAGPPIPAMRRRRPAGTPNTNDGDRTKMVQAKDRGG